MLQNLRDQTQGTGFKIMVGAIIVVLTLFGFGATGMLGGTDPEVAQIGDVEITQSLLALETQREQQRVLARAGPDFDASSIDQLALQQYVLEQLINRNVLAQTTDDFGITTPPEEVDKQILEAPAYQLDGKFNEPLYRQQVQAMGYRPVDFVQAFSDALSQQKLRDGVSNTALLPDWELQEMVRVVNQRRDIAYLPLNVEQFAAQVEVSEEEISLRYNENSGDYMTPLTVDASYVSLSIDDLVDEESISVEPGELQSLYDEQRSAALADEQRDSSHILVQVNDQRNEAQALELITEVQTRLVAGETFEALAEEVSEDPGSAATGGTLGAAGKGIFDPDFEVALWALAEDGDVSAPVLSSFGYHLIRLNSVVVPEYPAFEAQQAELEGQVRRGKAGDIFVERAGELERSSYEERYALDSSAQALGLTVSKVQGVSRAVSGADPIFGNPQVLDALFSDVVVSGENSEAVEVADDHIVIVRIDEQYAPEPIALAEVSAQIGAQIRQEKALAAIETAKSEGLIRLEAGDAVNEIADSYGSRWQRLELAARSTTNDDIPQDVLDAAFELPRPAAGAKVSGVAQTSDGAALITVTRVIQGTVDTTTDAEIAQFRRIGAGRTARLDFQSLFEAARDKLGITRAAG